MSTAEYKRTLPSRLVLTVAGMLMLMIVLSGCSANGSVTEEQIRADILNNDEALDSYGFTITTVEILSEENDKDLGVYSCEVQYMAENEDADYYGIMDLVYMKADKQWRLSKVGDSGNEFSAKNDCGESIPTEYIKQGYEDMDAWGNSEPNLKFSLTSQESITDNFESFTYEVTGTDSVRTWNDVWTLGCSFTLDKGWSVENANLERKNETWDLCGKYVCKNEHINMTIDLTSIVIDVANKKVTTTMTWEFTTYEYRPVVSKGETYYSDGPVTEEASFDYRYGWFTIRGNIANVNICGSAGNWPSVEGSNEDGRGIFVGVKNYGLAPDEYWMQKVA